MAALAEIAPICEREQHPSPQKWLREPKARVRQAAYTFKKDIRHRARQGYAAHVANRRTAEWMRALSRELAAGQREQRKVYVERRFHELATQWESETRHVSSLTDLASHPSYQRIVGLGWDVVPFLLKDLQQKRRFWFPALTAITQIRPFDPGDIGNGKRMTEAWIKWGTKKGFI
jgi:hypothetical protein